MKKAIDKRLDEIAKDALTEPVDPSWTLEEDTMVIDAGKPGVEFDRDEVMDEVTERIRTMNFKAYEVKVQTRAPQKIDVDKIAAEAKAEPKNATVDKRTEKPFCRAWMALNLMWKKREKLWATAASSPTPFR